MTAAEREPAHACCGHDAAGDREAVSVCGGVDLAPRAAAADPHGPGVCVHSDVAQERQVDDDAVVAGSQASPVVAAAADGERKAAVPGERDHAGDLLDVRARGDQCGPLVDHAVVDLAGLVVLGVVAADQASPKAREPLPRGLRRIHDVTHAFSLPVVRTISLWLVGLSGIGSWGKARRGRAATSARL